MGGNTPKIILHYHLEDEEGFPSSGGNTFWLKHKNGKPFTPQEAKALVNKISNKKIHDFQRKSTNPSGSGQNIYYVDGKFIREGKITEGMKRFKVYVSGEKEPLILLGKNVKDVKHLAHQMIQNSSVKIRKVAKEGFAGNLKGKKKEKFINRIKE